MRRSCESVEIIHIVPASVIGGVENAARSCPHIENENYRYSVIFLDSYAGEYSWMGRLSFIPSWLRHFWTILTRRPDFLVLSLWKSVIFGLLVKAVRPSVGVVSFLHNNKVQSGVDWLLNRIAIAISSFIWVDSEATAAARVPAIYRDKVRVISFILSKIQLSENVGLVARPNFVFWGRLHKQKNLIRSFMFIEKITKTCSECSYILVGPDCGVEDQLRQYVAENDLSGVIRFMGPKDYDEIRNIAQGVTFYLQTSDHEGMAMSVVESMMMGLVPVVTPAGEIASYCDDMNNSVIVDDIDDAVKKTLSIIGDPRVYQEMRLNAIRTFNGRPSYGESVAAACADLVIVQSL